MKLSDFMAERELDDEGMAELVRLAGGKVERSTISRLRRGKTWLSRDLAVAISRATGNRVTAADFVEELALDPEARAS
jgi:plasmid maintenance system antidote protein VapI